MAQFEPTIGQGGISLMLVREVFRVLFDLLFRTTDREVVGKFSLLRFLNLGEGLLHRVLDVQFSEEFNQIAVEESRNRF